MTRVLGKWLLVGMLGLAALWSLSLQAGIVNSKHDLSAGSTATVKAATEAQICVFCHVPHNASPVAPLWNRTNPTHVYTAAELYGTGSTTMTATMGQPDGSSLLCLSCHDGTIALGSLVTQGPITMAGSVTTMPVGVSNFNHNLSNHHPVSFTYSATSKSKTGNTLAAVGSLGSKGTAGPEKVKLESGKMQCMSCHDAHGAVDEAENPIPKFLVKSNDKSALCLTCHINPDWGTLAGGIVTGVSIHATATNSYSGTNTSFGVTTYTSPWTHTSGTTVAANACENCHRPHTAPGAARLLNYAKEEDNCLVCHNGAAMSPAVKNILADYNKTYTHGMTAIGHDPMEGDSNGNVTTKHVECVDCHNPHQTKGPASTNASGSNPTGASLPLPLTGVRGVTIDGTAVAPATREEEICFRCHGATGSTAASTLVSRVYIASPVGSIAAKFKTTNASYHPVAGPVPTTAKSASLMAGWTKTSTMKCTHCHNSNTAPTVGTGAGPNGPHGSTNRPILAKSYTYQDSGSGASYLLCYSCHDSGVVDVDDAASFRYHNKHIGKGMACSACHDAHGSTQKYLINFDKTVALPSGGVGPIWTPSATPNRGSCTLSCHGTNHNPKTY